MTTVLIKNATILTLGKQNRVLSGHDCLIRDGKIEKIDANITIKADSTINASGKVLMPGMINAHMHFYSTLVRGLGKAEPSKDFQEVLEHLWWRLDKKLSREDVYYSTLVMAVEAIRKGTTTLIDHHASPGFVRGSLNEIAGAIEQTGLRASLCYEVSDRDGEQIIDEGLEENADFIRRVSRDGGDQFRALFGLHASFTLSDRTLKRAADLARSLNAGFHVHVAEAASDQARSRELYGAGVVQRLKNFGILGPDTIAAHCIHLSDEEMDTLAESRTFVVHNPQSNLNNAVGIADIVKMNEKGIRVGLGTDAMTVNMFEEVRVALWAQHLLQKNPSAAFMDAAGALFFTNAEIAAHYWGMPLGTLSEGGPADMTLLDYCPPTPLNGDTVLGHLVFGLSQAVVDTTIVGGRILMQNRDLKIGIDEREMAERSRESARKLWDRF